MSDRFQFHVQKTMYQMSVECFLIEKRSNDSIAYYTIEEGRLTGTVIPVGEPCKPLFVFPLHNSVGPEMFQAMAEGLKDAGYVAEVDNRARIVAEAQADERGSRLDRAEKQIDRIIERLLNKVE